MTSKEAELRFKEWAARRGCIYRVAGDYAYSSRPMGMGCYARLKRINNESLLLNYEGVNVILKHGDKI